MIPMRNNSSKRKLLVVFLSCEKNKHLWSRLLQIIPNSLVFYGDPSLQTDFSYRDRILALKCKDTYDYLPVKIHAMIRSILKIPSFKDITHVLKIDDHDTKLTPDINDMINRVYLRDYNGQRVNKISKHNTVSGGNRTWHFHKCPENSFWDNKRYDGEYTTWVDGGCGYVLSRHAMDRIALEDPGGIYKKHIYEDVMIALILKKNGILPFHTSNIIVGDK